MKSIPEEVKQIPRISKRTVNEYDLISNRINVLHINNIRNYGMYYSNVYGLHDEVLESICYEGDAIDYILQHYTSRIHADEILEDVIRNHNLTITKTYIGNDIIKLYYNHMDYTIEYVNTLGSFGVIELYKTNLVEDACLLFTQLIEGK